VLGLLKATTGAFKGFADSIAPVRRLLAQWMISASSASFLHAMLTYVHCCCCCRLLLLLLLVVALECAGDAGVQCCRWY